MNSLNYFCCTCWHLNLGLTFVYQLFQVTANDLLTRGSIKTLQGSDLSVKCGDKDSTAVSISHIKMVIKSIKYCHVLHFPNLT